MKLSRARRRSSSKSYTKKHFKTPVVKTIGEDGNGASKNCTKRITPTPSPSVRDSCTDIPNKAENEKVPNGSGGDKNSDKNLKKTKSPLLFVAKHACTSTPSELIEKTENEDNVIKSLDRQEPVMTHGDADFSTNSSLSALERSEYFQPVSVLDEFLCESSQTTSTRLKADESSKNVEPHFSGKVSHRKLQKQASILDDLI